MNAKRGWVPPWSILFKEYSNSLERGYHVDCHPYPSKGCMAHWHVALELAFNWQMIPQSFDPQHTVISLLALRVVHSWYYLNMYYIYIYVYTTHRTVQVGTLQNHLFPVPLSDQQHTHQFSLPSLNTIKCTFKSWKVLTFSYSSHNIAYIAT